MNKCLIGMGAKIMRVSALMALDETVLQHKPVCILDGCVYETQYPSIVSLARLLQAKQPPLYLR